MVIAQSFLARTFGAYALQLFEIADTSLLVPTLSVGVLLVAFGINLSANRLIEGVSSVLGFIKVGGIVLDLIVLAGFLWIKISTDLLVVGVACTVMLLILFVEIIFLRRNPIVPK